MLLESKAAESREVLRDECLMLTAHLNHTANSTAGGGGAFRESIVEQTSDWK
jgi:hypothetical protein